jgi:hypothetical protein
MNTNKTLTLSGLVFILTACESADWDSFGPAPVAAPPASVNQLPGGLWYGTLTLDAAMGSEEILAMVGEDGRFRIVSGETAIQMSGDVAVAGSLLSASGRVIAGPGGTWPDGSNVGDLSIRAVITERDTMAGTWRTTAGESGSFELFYDQLYERDSALSLLGGMWTAYDDIGNPDVTFTIEDSGSFDGQNMQGCLSTGQFAIIDSRFNLYAVQSTISGCGLADDYSGLALIFDLIMQNDAMFFAVDNGTFAVLLGLQQ